MKVRKLNFKTILIRVAAVVIIFVASWFFHDQFQNGNINKSLIDNSETENEEAENIQVLMEAEVFYTSQINTAKNEITKLAGDNNLLIEEINFDMVELDNVFEELKNDLKDNSDNEEVIGAMIQNYRIKLEILKEILVQLKKTQKSDTNENDHEI